MSWHSLKRSQRHARLTSAPAEVSTKQLRELNLKLRKVEVKESKET